MRLVIGTLCKLALMVSVVAADSSAVAVVGEHGDHRYTLVVNGVGQVKIFDRQNPRAVARNFCWYHRLSTKQCRHIENRLCSVDYLFQYCEAPIYRLSGNWGKHQLLVFRGEQPTDAAYFFCKERKLDERSQRQIVEKLCRHLPCARDKLDLRRFEFTLHVNRAGGGAWKLDYYNTDEPEAAATQFCSWRRGGWCDAVWVSKITAEIQAEAEKRNRDGARERESLLLGHGHSRRGGSAAGDDDGGRLNSHLPAGNLYSVLGVRQDADAGTVRRAYRALSMQFHPDKVSAKH